MFRRRGMPNAHVGVARGPTGATLDEDVQLGTPPAAVGPSDVPLGYSDLFVGPEPVTAQDFVFAWQRAVDPELGSPYAWYMELTLIVALCVTREGHQKSQGCWHCRCSLLPIGTYGLSRAAFFYDFSNLEVA